MYSPRITIRYQTPTSSDRQDMRRYLGIKRPTPQPADTYTARCLSPFFQSQQLKAQRQYLAHIGTSSNTTGMNDSNTLLSITSSTANNLPSGAAYKPTRIDMELYFMRYTRDSTCANVSTAKAMLNYPNTPRPALWPLPTPKPPWQALLSNPNLDAQLWLTTKSARAAEDHGFLD
ncbi:hypothetical protein HPB48_014537 [Haemaphysalis longicornis]|uniref:Uncharacterized protein n=1 Tax=Haemaphysalis longicornis TaxID=44386 RepID=A0A9J6GY26_HAELO|nr:hypothetical protein HPB48_014537 [Haemaphysalis longicornis]